MELDRFRRKKETSSQQGSQRELEESSRSISEPRPTGGIGRLMPRMGVQHPDRLISTDPKIRNLYVPRRPSMNFNIGRKKKRR